GQRRPPGRLLTGAGAMGRVHYGDTAHEAYRVDDRTRAHGELAISSPLRFGGAFALTLESDHVAAGRGPHIRRLHAASPMQFRYQGDRRQIPINPRWVAGLSAIAASDQGLRIVPEPPAVAPDARAPLYG